MARKKREVKPLLNVSSKPKWKKYKFKEDKGVILPLNEEIMKGNKDEN